jgi:cobalt-precorrin 5A hydrolase
VVDECGKFVISLLSGHLGGANALALKTAEILGAEPVVTTATDLHDRFAVDVFAKNNHCAIFNMKAAKEVSAAILAGESVGFYSEFPWAGSLPRGLKVCTPEDSGKPEAGIAVTVHRACLPFTSTVQIVPKAVVLGLGCKKDKEAENGKVIDKGSELFKKAPIKRTGGKVDKYNKILEENKLLFTAELIKEKIQHAYTLTNENEMKLEIEEIIDMCETNGNKHLLWFAKLLKSHMYGITSHAKYNISTGKIEGINNKIKTLRRQAYGYPDDEYFFLKLFDISRTK